jgi:hypothetical protein
MCGFPSPCAAKAVAEMAAAVTARQAKTERRMWRTTASEQTLDCANYLTCPRPPDGYQVTSALGKQSVRLCGIYSPSERNRNSPSAEMPLIL